jgi:cholest-4-en-3-one 26-monooxygenase
VPPVEIDFLSGAFFTERARDAYRWMRQTAPVHLDERNQLWGVATYDGVLAVERDPATFSSALGSRPDTGPLPWMIDLDGSDHTKRRKLVSRGFTPARVRAHEPHVRDLCDGLIDAICEQGTCDAVADLAAPLPMIVIGDMLGVPAADRDDLLRWSHGMLEALTGAPEGYEAAADAFASYVAYAHGVIADRRAQPRDDLFSALVHAEVDGERLTDDEIVFESLLLLIGGDETTRHVIAGGLEQLLGHPDQLGRLVDDRDLLPTAVEEMLRWVSPIKSMARTTTCETELCGTRLPQGSKLVLLFESANFDEAHFESPDRFDITRAPNEHLAFGFGPHVCLGASLARMEIRVMVDRILDRLPDLHLTPGGELTRTITGLHALPLKFRASTPGGQRPPHRP